MIHVIVERSRTLNAPLTFLDGNFIQSIERLSKTESTLLLHEVQQNCLIDPYKIIRGLVSQKRWLDAIQTLTSSVSALKGNRSEWFSRPDIGRARLAILHASSSHNVHRVVDCLNATKKQGRPFSLNDSEIECVLSKSLEDQTSSFWKYCLLVFNANYASKAEYQRPRIPSTAVTSLLFRSKELPWETALQIFKKFVVTEEDFNCNAAQKTSFSVVVDSLVQLLYHQQQRSEADRIISHLQGISLPSVFLLNASEETLRIRITASNMDSRVLFHVLSSSRKQQVARALYCVNLYMIAVAGFGFLGIQRPSSKVTNFKWVSAVPASVHIGVLRCIRRSPEPQEVQFEMISSYMEHILCPHASSRPDLKQRETIYCTVYEALLIYLDFTLDSRRADFFSDALRRVFKRHGAFPPFHMFLPNQIDRLLPRMEYANLGDPDSVMQRIFFMKNFVVLVAESLAKVNDDATSKVVLNSALKMCCRVAEYEKKFKLLGINQAGFYLQSDGISLSTCAVSIAEKEAELFGPCISSSSLVLLYKTLALASFEPPDVEAALRITKKISGVDGRNTQSYFKGRGVQGCLRSHHYEMFQKCFGWEMGLDFWYRQFPQDVLKRVAQNADAIDHCLNIDL